MSRRCFSAPLNTLILVITSFNIPIKLYACSVCGFGFDATRNAFLITTLVMSLVPLIAVGSIVGFIFWRKKHHGTLPPHGENP